MHYHDRDPIPCPECDCDDTIAGGLMLADGSSNGGYSHCQCCGIYFDVYGGDIIDPQELIGACWMSDKNFENGSKFE